MALSLTFEGATPGDPLPNPIEGWNRAGVGQYSSNAPVGTGAAFCNTIAGLRFYRSDAGYTHFRYYACIMGQFNPQSTSTMAGCLAYRYIDYIWGWGFTYYGAICWIPYGNNNATVLGSNNEIPYDGTWMRVEGSLGNPSTIRIFKGSNAAGTTPDHTYTYGDMTNANNSDIVLGVTAVVKGTNVGWYGNESATAVSTYQDQFDLGSAWVGGYQPEALAGSFGALRYRQ